MEKHIFEFETLNLQDQISQRKIEFRDGVESLQDSEAGQMVTTPDSHEGFKSRCRPPNYFGQFGAHSFPQPCLKSQERQGLT